MGAFVETRALRLQARIDLRETCRPTSEALVSRSGKRHWTVCQGQAYQGSVPATRLPGGTAPAKQGLLHVIRLAFQPSIVAGSAVKGGYLQPWFFGAQTVRSGAPAPVVVQLQPRLLTSCCHLLTSVPEHQGRFFGVSAPVELTLVAASSTTVAAALGFTRQQRRAYFIQQCLFRHVRRYLLVLSPSSLDLRVRGVFPRLRSC